MLKIDCIIGIDPGANGGIAVWRPNNPVTVVKMPKDLSELKKYFEHIKTISESPVVFIEKVQMRFDDMGAKAFRIQELLKSFQQLKDIMAFVDIPYIQVHPMSWQSALHLREKNEDKAERKKRYQRKAQESYPEIKVTLWNADALLLVSFGRMKNQTDSNWITQNLPAKQAGELQF